MTAVNVSTMSEDQAYDVLDRVDSETLDNSYTVGTEYDGGSNVAKLTYSGGRCVDMTYDALNLLDVVTETPDGGGGGITGEVADYGYRIVRGLWESRCERIAPPSRSFGPRGDPRNSLGSPPQAEVNSRPQVSRTR